MFTDLVMGLSILSSYQKFEVKKKHQYWFKQITIFMYIPHLIIHAPLFYDFNLNHFKKYVF